MTTNEELDRLRLAAEDAAGGPPSAEQVDALSDLVDALEARLAALTTPQGADAALAAIERVKKLLGPMWNRLDEYGEVPLRHAVSKTLELLAALDGAPEPEWDSITIPRPVVPFGPRGVPENDATADYLLDVIRKIDQGYAVIGGSNVTATVRKLLAEVGLALRALPGGGNDE